MERPANGTGGPMPAHERRGGMMTAETACDPLAAILSASTPEADKEAEARNRELAEAEARRARARAEARFSELCPPLYRHPEILAAMRERVPAHVMREAMDWRPAGLQSGLLLHGPTGGFKSTLLFQIARRVIVEEAKRAKVLRGETLARDAAAAFGDPAATAKWLDPFKRAAWLFIDELFKGNMTPSATAAVFEIVEHRTAHFLPTVATSNATGERVEASARDPAAQEAVPAILRRIRGEPGRPGFFRCLHVPAGPVGSRDTGGGT